MTCSNSTPGLVAGCIHPFNERACLFGLPWFTHESKRVLCVYVCCVCISVRHSTKLSSIPMACGWILRLHLCCCSSMKYAWHEPPPESTVERGGWGRSTTVRSEGALEEDLSQWITEDPGSALHPGGSWETVSTVTGPASPHAYIPICARHRSLASSQHRRPNNCERVRTSRYSEIKCVFMCLLETSVCACAWWWGMKHSWWCCAPKHEGMRANVLQCLWQFCRGCWLVVCISQGRSSQRLQ